MSDEPFGIGPKIEGLRAGYKVRINRPGSRFHRREGYITKITSEAGVYEFWVDLGKRQPRPLLCHSSELEIITSP